MQAISQHCPCVQSATAFSYTQPPRPKRTAVSASEEVNDKEYREAIWKAHNYLCLLCERPLDFSELEIDHVVPESWHNLPEPERMANLAEIGLPADFKILSRLNHAPLHGHCNNRKRAISLPKGLIAIYLNQIKSRQDALDTELRQLSRGRTLTIVLNMISNGLDKDRFSVDELADAMKAKGQWSQGSVVGSGVGVALGGVAGAAAISAGNYGAGITGISTTVGFASASSLPSNHNFSRIKFSNDKLKQQILEDDFIIPNMLRAIQQRAVTVRRTLLDGKTIYEMKLKNELRLFFKVENEEVTVLKLVQKRTR